ncbi:MAG: right-handed parallel beta-helix repeat-containing protein [Lentisphaeria bacterium]
MFGFCLNNVCRTLTLACLAAGAVMADGLNVAAYGAKGDGKTDDTPAFRQAFLAAGTAARCVTVPPGTYLLGPQPLELPPNVTLRGAGATTVLRAAPCTTTLLTLKDGCALADLAFDGRQAKPGEANDPGLIMIQGAKAIRLDRLRFDHVDRDCVFLDHAGNVTIADCDFAMVGLAINTVFSHHLRITGNRITDARVHGIEIWGMYNWELQDTSDIMITGNYVKNGGAGAIWASGGRDLVLANNVINGATDVGLDLEWCENAVITGNSVRRCKNGGISLFFACRNIAITGNAVTNDYPISEADAKEGWWVRSGIWLTYPNRGEFKGDHGHRDITIVGNTITCAPGQRRAIWIGGESQNVVINANAINGGGVWYGGEHQVNPMILSELPVNTVVPAVPPKK